MARRSAASVRDLVTQGYTPHSIAVRLGRSVADVQREIGAFESAQTSAPIDARAEVEIARLDRLESEYWDAWNRSKAAKEVSHAERESGADGYTETAWKRVEGQCGNPQYLLGIERCIDRRCRLLGLYRQGGNDG